jgi:hypothetical protein
MPVQINELVIRANIVEGDEKGKETEAKAGAKSDLNKDEIIKECAELVLEVLRNKSER